MLIGPVFRAELLRTSRKRHYYVQRVVYGIVLLMVLWFNYERLLVTSRSRGGGKPLISDFAEFALNTFIWFAVVQLVTLLLLVPTLFGGVIADEKQRKTMHYLMASRLSSGAIVLDKLAARWVHVAVFILLGLPVIGLLTLFGGVAWDYVIGAYAGTFSIVFFTAALAVLTSTFARRVGQGVLIAYLLEIVWLVGPPIFDAACRWLFPGFYLWISPLCTWALGTGPVSLLVWYVQPYRWVFGMLGPPAPFLDQFMLMMAQQCALGAIFLLIAAWQLRPVFRRQAEGGRRLTWFPEKAKRPRWLRRPECGVDAMLWKERHFARTDRFTKLVVLPATIVLTVIVLLTGDLDEKILRSFSSVRDHGYTAQSGEPIALNQWLQVVTPLYVALWMLAVAGASASAVTIEREQDTWDSLISTPLTGWEMIRGKAVGAIWGLRGFGALLSLSWLVGIAAGALHPLGLLLALLVVGVLTAFVVALGISASLTARTTGRSLTITIATLLFLNVGYFGIAYPITLVFWAPVPPVVPEWLSSGFTPRLASAALLSYRHFAQILEVLHGADIPRDLDLRAGAYGALVLVSYLAATVILFWLSLRRFERLADRPRRADGLPIESTTGGLKPRTAVTATRRTLPAKPG
jgi:ABC-type transport system involved in multi-copper enzyme maturation permease subunit